jgi:hypothetical protein
LLAGLSLALVAVVGILAFRAWEASQTRKRQQIATHRETIKKTFEAGDYAQAKRAIDALSALAPDDRLAHFANGYYQLLYASNDDEYAAAKSAIGHEKLHTSAVRRENASTLFQVLGELHQFLRRTSGSNGSLSAADWKDLPALQLKLNAALASDLEPDLTDVPILKRLSRTAKALADITPTQVAMYERPTRDSSHVAADRAYEATKVAPEPEVLAVYAGATFLFAQQVVNEGEIDELRLLLRSIGEIGDEISSRGSLTPGSMIQMRACVMGVVADLASLRLHPQLSNATLERFQKNLRVIARMLAEWPAEERDKGMTIFFELLSVDPTPSQMTVWKLDDPANREKHAERVQFLAKECGNLMMAWEAACSDPTFQAVIKNYKSKIAALNRP